MNHEVVCGDDREIFVAIIEGSLEFDLISLQLWNKITLSSRWPSSLKSLQITSSFLPLYSRIEHKALKNVPASGLSRSYCNPRRTRFWGVEMDFPSHGSQLSLAFLLSKPSLSWLQDISHKRLSHKSFSTSFGPFAQFLVAISHNNYNWETSL